VCLGHGFVCTCQVGNRLAPWLMFRFKQKGGKMSRGFDSRSDVSLECGLPFMRVLFTLFALAVL